MEPTTGSTVLRSAPLGDNPPVSKTVAGASALLQDLQGVTAAHEQLARVSEEAYKTSNKVQSDPDQAIGELADQLKELVCSYAYTHDVYLSPRSETPKSRSAKGTPAAWEKDPSKLAEPVVNPLTVPSFPGNLFYMACRDDLAGYNPDLAAAFAAAKQANKDQMAADPAYVPKTDTAMLAGLMPLYAVPRGDIPAELLTRWSNLIDLTAEDTWTLEGTPITVRTEADEVIAIAGLQQEADYRLFCFIQKLDEILEGIPLLQAQQLVSIFQQLGYSPNHAGTWLARGRILLEPRGRVGTAMLQCFTERRSLAELRDVWDWVGSKTVADSFPPENELESDSSLRALAVRSLNYVNLDRGDLLAGFDVSLDQDDETRVGRIQGTLERWKTQFDHWGGILGFDGIVLVAALTALERCKMAVKLGKSDDDLTKLAADGTRLAGYLSNAGPLVQAFQALEGN